MSLQKYEKFLELSVKQLVNYLFVHGLNTSGKKVELVSQACAVFELKMDIITSSELRKDNLKVTLKECLQSLILQILY